MKKIISTLLVSLFIFAGPAWAEKPTPAAEPVAAVAAEEVRPSEIVNGYKYTKMSLLDPFLEVPSSLWTFTTESFGEGTFWPWMGILGSTALLYTWDAEILNTVQRWGRETGLGNDDNTRTFASFGDVPLFRGPTDTGSWLYYLGDGWMHTGFMLSFSLYGHFAESPRAFNTGMQILHGMFVSTFWNQAFKRATGRQSPFVSTEARGRWRPFPSVKAYQEETAKRDAFPSGHIMTATMTFTVILENYPEHAWWVRPVEVVWLSLLGLQMVNNGVHWASDYPLGIAMGYLTGKIVTRMGREKLYDNDPDKDKMSYLPMMDGDAIGLQAIYEF